jgi:hypothetical protein
MESAICDCQFSPPVNDHPPDLAGALKDREDSGLTGSFRRSADCRSPWYQHGSSTGFPRAATVSGRHAHVAEHGHTRPKRAPQSPLTALGRELRRVSRRPGNSPVRQWRAGGPYTGRTPGMPRKPRPAPTVPARRRHGPDRPVSRQCRQARRPARRAGSIWRVSESFPELSQAVLEHAQPDRIDIVRAKRHLLGRPAR